MCIFGGAGLSEHQAKTAVRVADVSASDCDSAAADVLSYAMPPKPPPERPPEPPPSREPDGPIVPLKEPPVPPPWRPPIPPVVEPPPPAT